MIQKNPSFKALLLLPLFLIPSLHASTDLYTSVVNETTQLFQALSALLEAPELNDEDPFNTTPEHQTYVQEIIQQGKLWNNAYHQELPYLKYSTTSSLESFYKAANSKKFVFYADIHNLDSIHQNVIHLIDYLMSHNQKKKVFIAEFISYPHQSTVDDYIDGKIADEDLKSRINYAQEDFGNFEWDSFLNIMKTLKKYKIKTLAVMKEKPDQTWALFVTRDLFTMKVVDDYCQKNPDAQVIFMHGEWHIVGIDKDRLLNLIESRYPKQSIRMLSFLPEYQFALMTQLKEPVQVGIVTRLNSLYYPVDTYHQVTQTMSYSDYDGFGTIIYYYRYIDPEYDGLKQLEAMQTIVTENYNQLLIELYKKNAKGASIMLQQLKTSLTLQAELAKNKFFHNAVIKEFTQDNIEKILTLTQTPSAQ